MYNHLSLSLLVLSLWAVIANTQTCVSSTCNIALFKQPTTLKSNATNVYYVGNMYNNQVDSNTLTKMSILDINNDPSILPDVRLELYSLSFSTQQHAVIGALAMRQAGVQAIIENAEDDFAVPTHDIALAFGMPLYTMRAMDDALKEKRIYSMLTRVFPSSAATTDAMVALIASLQYTGALVITTKSTHSAPSAETFIEQAKARGIKNVFAVSIPPFPTPNDYRIAVNQSKILIEEFAIRPVVMLTTVTTGPGLMRYLWEGGIYGPDIFYMFSAEMTRAVLSPTATDPRAHSLLAGSFIFFPRDGVGKKAQDYLTTWRARNMTLLPGNPTSPQSQWLAYDASWVLARGLNQAMQQKSFSQVSTTDILNVTSNINFEGVSGPMSFDVNRDYNAVNGMTFYQIYNVTAFKFGVVSTYVNGTFNITVPYVYYNLSPTPPNPGYCKYCFNGKCNAQSVCVCDLGYQGDYCSDTIKTYEKSHTIQIVVPVVCFIVILSGIVIYYFKWRREQLIKDLASRQRSDINRTEIKLLERIGRGASGAVYKALFRGTEVAAKSLLTSSTSADVLEAFKMETAIMCALRHPNIVLFMGSCYDNVQKEMLLVMEFCSRGSLHDLLNDPKTNLSYELLLHLACQSAQGMNFLHESIPPIIHRDLKSHNILLDDKFNAKISDFGLTKFKDKKETSNSHELGTVFWSAPEVLNGKSHSEKSDCYSFGIVLWEMWHRHDPYPMMDLVTVAMEVMNKGIRPIMDPSTPEEIQALIRDCWHQDPMMRPDFQGITTRLRNLSMQHPMHTFATGHQSRIEAPTGKVYLVHSNIPALFNLFDRIPKPCKRALTVHNHLVRTNLELYGGYEVRMKSNGGFFVVFNNCASAINWAIATQVGLTHLSWPDELIACPEACEVVEKASVIFRGLRVRMSITSGAPSTDIDSATGRMSYVGPAAEKAKGVLKQITEGSIIVDATVMDEINTKKMPLIETVVSKPSSQTVTTGDIYHMILPATLMERQNYVETRIQPNSITLEDTGADETVVTIDKDSSPAPSAFTKPSWLIPYKHLIVNESIGKGQVGDYYRGLWNQRRVAVKLLVNQKLREDDYISLLADVSLLNRIKHPNLLTVHGVCTKRGNISIIVDLVENGSLKDMIAREGKLLTNSHCVNIAHDIAVGMSFLTSLPNKDLHIHDNFKSNNILVSKDYEVKITDFGQTNIKDLARTMTSISSVAWTAPEILNGDPITPKSAVYSFGIILWELFSKKVPYDGEHPLKVVSKILSGFRPAIPECPAPIQALMQNCWNEDPELRPTWHVIMTELSYMQ